jgi:RND family efflux transporter MFP subunit
MDSPSGFVSSSVFPSPGASAWIAALILAPTLLMIAGCDRSSAAPPPAFPPAAVTVSHPVERDVVDFDEYTGRLEAAESVDIRARVSGFIDSAQFQEGSVVQAGALLFVIDPRPFQAEVDRASAEVARAQAQVQQTTEEFNRLEKVRSAAATERELLNARYNKAAAEAALAAAKAALASAQLNLQFTRVTAPITGRIGRKLVTQGNLITGGGSGGGPATLLTTITSLDPVYCYFDADERSILRQQRLARQSNLQTTRDAHIRVDLALADETGFPHQGVVDFTNNRLDPATGTLQVRASFRNPDGFFTPGLFARLRIPGSAPHRATLVADEAIGSDQAQRFVMVVDAQNVVQPRPVTVGQVFEGLRVVQGVTPEDWVIVNGLMKARPGMKVDPKPAPMPMRVGGAATAPPSDGKSPTSQPGTNQPGSNQSGTTRPAATQPVAAGRGSQPQ